MQRITGLPEEQVLAYEARAEAAMREALAGVMDIIARRIERSAPVLASVLVAADGDEIPADSVPEGDGLPPGQPYVSPDDLTSIPPLAQEAMASSVAPIVAEVFIEAAARTYANMVEASSIATLPSVGSLAAERYLAQASNTFEQIGDTLWANARTELLDGFERGESIPQLAARLRASAGVTARTAVLVARTQVNEASNAGSFETAQVSGLTMKKEWIATPDLRTRPTHLAADGQRVDLNEPFIVGGFSAMFPAAPTLPPSERYSCRCAIGYVLPDKSIAQMRENLAQQQVQEELPGTEGPLTQLFPKEEAPGIDLPARGANPPGYVRPSLREAKTPRQLRRVWQDEVETITGFPFVVDAMPRGISMVTAREYAEGTLQMFAQFPGAKVDRIHWFDDPASSSYAQVRRGGNAIEFNMRYASEAGRPKFLAARRKDVAGYESGGATSWGVRNDLGGQGVVYHEFTHILDIENGREVVHGQIVPLLIRHAQTEGVLDIDDLVKRRISSYATKNYQEMVAEAGTDVMVNGAAASQLSHDIFDLVRAEYRRRGFEIRTAPVDDLAREAERQGEVFATGPAPGWTPGAWKATPLDRAREEIAEREFEDYVKNQEQFGLAVDESYGRRLGKGIAEQELPASASAYANGPYTIIIRDAENVGDDALRAMQAQMDAVLESNPLDGRPFTLRLGGTSSTGNAAMSGPEGISMFDEIEMKPRGDLARRHKFLMPSAVERPKAVYDLTHEIGHSHMLQDPARGVRARALYEELDLQQARLATMRGEINGIRPESDTLGFYGASDPLEAYAEAFAEWNLSAGLTENAMVLRYAQTFGWRDPLDFPGEAFPKAAAPKPLAKMTVAELRAEAKARGLTVPAGTRKADLVRMIDDAPPPPSAITQAIVEPPPLSRAPLAIQRRQDELRADAARPVLADKSRRMGGQSAYTTKVEHAGGPSTITKDYTRTGETKAQAIRSTDAEELGVLVDDAVGLRAPTVIRTGPRSVEQEFLDGQSGEDILPWPHTITDELVASDDGRLMGLSDVLLGDTDRNAGNFIRLADGRLAPIDRGSAFASPKLAGAKDSFGAYFAPAGKWRKVIDVNPADLAVIRARLEALRPEFERLGRATWHRQVMARLVEVEKRADPNAAIRLAEARPDLATIRKAARTQAATIATQRGNAALIARIDELVQAKASKAVIRQELDPALRETEQLYAGAASEVADALRAAVDTGDAAKIRAALTRQSKASGLTPIGKAGAKAKFDPATMEGVGGTAIPDGADVIVVRRGAKLAGIETPEKAIVRLAAPSGPITPTQFGAKIKTAAKGQEALDAAPLDITGRAYGPTYEPDALDRYRVAPEVNGSLRPGGSTSQLAADTADIREIDQAFDASRLTGDVEVWRGLQTGRTIFGPPDAWGSDLAGHEWVDPAYSSTTASDAVAHRFIQPGGVRMRLLVPRGSKAIKLSNAPTPGPGISHAEEAELLLARGARFRVVKDRGWIEVDSAGRKTRVRDLDVEVIVPEKTPPISVSSGSTLATRVPKSAPKPKPSTAKTVAKGDFAGLTRVGEQMGGNPGGIFEAGDGSRWYVKAAEEGQARSEALALDLYRAAGLDAPEIVIGQGVEGLGQRQVATRFLDDAQVDLRARLASDPAYIADVQDGFAVDAWLGNWDVVGANPAPGRGWDNIVSVAGRPVRIEAGGALRFRGLGGTKSFGETVTELDTLRDPATARRAAELFRDMTPEQVIASAERVRKVTPAKIKALVKRNGLDPELADTLIARRADILRRAAAMTGPKPMTVREYNAAIRAAAKGQDALDATPLRVDDYLTTSDPLEHALIAYRQTDFAPVNDALRMVGGEKYGVTARQHSERLIGRIDEAMGGSRLTRDVELWRSPGSGREIFGDPRTWGDDLAGFEWVDPAYSSTSAVRAVADRFTRNDGVRLRILAPRGSKAIQLSGMPIRRGPLILASDGEAEILLARGARYRVVRDHGWTEIKGTTHVVRDLDVEVVVPDETPPPLWATK